jgi:hypothetical protein
LIKVKIQRCSSRLCRIENPAKARFLKMENLKMPTGKFALSGFRVFGKGAGKSQKR